MSNSVRGLSLISGGLDSQLAIAILRRAGAEVIAVKFASPFFKEDGTAVRAAAALNVELRTIDFTDDIVALLKSPPHGFGGAANPCIDCHARMIARAGELMNELGFDFVATGEVVGQRPMSQNRQSIGVVAKCSGMEGRLIRPLSAKLLEPTIPEKEGRINRELLLDISGRNRERQIALAAELGIVDYPAPAGGCRLTETGFANRTFDLMRHEGLDYRPLLELLTVGRRFRLPGGASVILGRDARENELLVEICTRMQNENCAFKPKLLQPTTGIGPNALIPNISNIEDEKLAQNIVDAYIRGTTEVERKPFKKWQLV